jgi:D-erythritol 1-phosphate dehydrogenase
VHYARLYGTHTGEVLGDAAGMADLGKDFGGQLYCREVEYLRRAEWARTTEDILERRTKHRLHLSKDQKLALARWLA